MRSVPTDSVTLPCTAEDIQVARGSKPSTDRFKLSHDRIVPQALLRRHRQNTARRVPKGWLYRHASYGPAGMSDNEPEDEPEEQPDEFEDKAEEKKVPDPAVEEVIEGKK
eukprot:g52592.t1